MKISIWQQFASNHSNGFTIVGQFESTDAAIKAAKDLEDMLEAIYLQSIGYSDDEPVQAELDLGKKFGINWTEHLDWIHTDEYKHVLQFDQYVAVSDHHGSTWQGRLYFPQIMTQLAASVYGGADMDSTVIGVELSCIAPNQEVADTIFGELNRYFSDVRAEKDEINSAPWKQFANQKINKYYDFQYSDVYYGYIYQDDIKLSFDHLTFGTIGVGLPAMIAYLKDKGCSQIEYTIRDVDMGEQFEEDYG